MILILCWGASQQQQSQGYIELKLGEREVGQLGEDAHVYFKYKVEP